MELLADVWCPYAYVGLQIVGQRRDLDFRGGGDGTRTHDFLLAKQVL